MARPFKGMHPEEIKAAIRKRGTTLAALSEQWGYERSAISCALMRPYPTVQKRIGEFLRIRPQSIWPERYRADGTAITAYQRSQDSTADTADNNQSALAA